MVYFAGLKAPFFVPLQSEIIVLQSVDSTNNYAASLIKLSEVVEGTVVLTYHQTNGRGQRGNSWSSNPGQNLLFSIVLRPHFLNPADQFGLNRMVSLALVDYLKQQGVSADIKWPNDILVNEQKIAGVLIENIIRGNHLEYTIVGIGLNVNQQIFASEWKATSMSLETGIQRDLLVELRSLISSIEKAYAHLQFNPEKLSTAYLDNLYGFQQPLYYRDGDSIYKASIEKIGDQGELHLLKADGQKIIKLFKEIELLGKNGL